MIIGNISGLQIFALLLELYFEYGESYLRGTIGNTSTRALTIFLMVIFYIMVAGGISVIIGTTLVLVHLHKIGKLIISLGTGTGLLGITIFLLIETTIINPINSWLDFGLFIFRLVIDLYFLGIILVLIGRRKMKKISEEDTNENLFLPADYEKEDEMERSEIIVKCPVCSAGNSKVDSFCQSCGTALDYNFERNL
ncbi:MAG: zinc ribbon domain-containing protein [Promethearchaeota archaeon]|nr:MAG: zinc ribbon domain-containing protein [Candidatus Lokiarchaeota archaeon]